MKYEQDLAQSMQPMTNLRRENYPDFDLLYATGPVAARRFAVVSSRESRLQSVEIPTLGAEIAVDPQGLPDRLMQTLVWGALGKSLQDQSKELYMAESTVKSHRAMLFERIGAVGMTNAVHLAFTHGLLSPQTPPQYKLRLSPREQDVLVEMGRGHVKEDVGKKLYLSYATVAAHVHNLLQKNDLHSVTHAVTLGYLSGTIPLSD